MDARRADSRGRLDGGDPDERAGQPGERPVEVRRSARRRRTVSAYEQDGRLVVLIPAGFSGAQERAWVDRMRSRLQTRRERRTPGDAELESRARRLSTRYLGGRAVAESVTWVGNQRRRWGSCTPSTRTIRISNAVQGMPGWVLDYVLLHELAHLLVPGHGRDFWELLAVYPRLERARGYLEGVAAAAHLDISDDDVLDANHTDDTEDTERAARCSAPEAHDRQERDARDDLAETYVQGAHRAAGHHPGPRGEYREEHGEREDRPVRYARG